MLVSLVPLIKFVIMVELEFYPAFFPCYHHRFCFGHPLPRGSSHSCQCIELLVGAGMVAAVMGGSYELAGPGGRWWFAHRLFDSCWYRPLPEGSRRSRGAGSSRVPNGALWRDDNLQCATHWGIKTNWLNKTRIKAGAVAESHMEMWESACESAK